jgi:putative peptidoglycan lipid II flippase
MRLSLFVALPASVLLVVLAHPLVVLIFQRGEFDAAASAETAKALAAQGLGIWSVAAVRQLVTAHYALGDTRTPALVSLADFAVFVLLALSLRPSLGHVGISLAVSGASLAQMLLLGWRLGRRGVDAAGVVRSGVSTLLACTPAALAAWAVARLPAGAGLLGRAAPGLLASLAFAIVFLVSARLLDNKELELLWAAVRRRATRA